MPAPLKKKQPIRVKLIKQDKTNKRWIWRATSGGESHKVTIKSNEKETKHLKDADVSFSCSCPAFLYWGSDYWARKGGYLDTHRPDYRFSRAKGRKPKIRDPRKERLMCKHVLRVYDEYKDVKFP